MNKKIHIDGSVGNGLTVDLTNSASMKTVKEVCELFKITRKTLFYYDKISLVKPTTRVGSQNHKMYGDKALKQLAIICLYRKAGYRIEEIKDAKNPSTWNKVQERLKKEKEDIIRKEVYLRKIKKYVNKGFESTDLHELLRQLEGEE